MVTGRPRTLGDECATGSYAVIFPVPGDKTRQAFLDRSLGVEAEIAPARLDVGAGPDHVARRPRRGFWCFGCTFTTGSTTRQCAEAFAYDSRAQTQPRSCRRSLPVVRAASANDAQEHTATDHSLRPPYRRAAAQRQRKRGRRRFPSGRWGLRFRSHSVLLVLVTGVRNAIGSAGVDTC
jgi:hypothetical protein